MFSYGGHFYDFAVKVRPPNGPDAEASPQGQAPAQASKLCVDIMPRRNVPGQGATYTFGQWCNESALIPATDWALEQTAPKAGAQHVQKKKKQEERNEERRRRKRKKKKKRRRRRRRR